MLSDENIQRYAKALYPVALLLILVPLADLTLRAFPPQFGSLQWRFGTVGLLLGNFGTILLGAGLIGLIATFCGHRGILRVVGYGTLAGAIITLAILALFLLDAVQMRQLANANIKRAILMSSAGALFTGLFGTFTLIAIGRGAMVAGRNVAGIGRAGPRRTGPSPLVVGGPNDAV
ncbi:MAG: hypothetical protein JO180_07430 [Gemmatirosa sp.]|nr:hypothetical protein [Gemmatirosa sp.]